MSEKKEIIRGKRDRHTDGNEGAVGDEVKRG